MLKRWILVSALVLAASVALLDNANAMDRPVLIGNPCRTPDTATAKHLHYLRLRASGASPVSVTWRGSSKVPFVTDTTGLITVVADSATCARAIASYDTLMLHGDSAVTEIEVIQADTLFVISHPLVRPGEWVGRFVVDTGMRPIAGYLY